ncbi:hypothetical protein L226DRAFT_351151 [Lentinus tigrinus ALCF2SS1-7]|uniref:uncharacterized protein n=1 Tax=Lentinus tigrinus ALCF2SS1-7 TaxID=1328758 RepID=UPI001165DD2C|nr:hypothetical protein L226DRAFT_351151 [Lentinus tigrinus ALCF2SS1-7]
MATRHIVASCLAQLMNSLARTSDTANEPFGLLQQASYFSSTVPTVHEDSPTKQLSKSVHPFFLLMALYTRFPIAHIARLDRVYGKLVCSLNHDD